MSAAWTISDMNKLYSDEHHRSGQQQLIMAVKTKQRRILVRLVSTALTGFFYTTSRPRIAGKLSMMKYDPVVKKHVLFTEAKIK